MNSKKLVDTEGEMVHDREFGCYFVDEIGKLLFSVMHGYDGCFRLNRKCRGCSCRFGATGVATAIGIRFFSFTSG